MTKTYESMAEIEKRYQNEWVIIDEPNATKYHVVLGGHIVYHGPDKLAMLDFLKSMPIPHNVAVWYIGPLCDPGEEILLNVGLFL